MAVADPLAVRCVSQYLTSSAALLACRTGDGEPRGYPASRSSSPSPEASLERFLSDRMTITCGSATRTGNGWEGTEQDKACQVRLDWSDAAPERNKVCGDWRLVFRRCCLCCAPAFDWFVRRGEGGTESAR